jgi:hypothetical protein
VAFLIGPAVKVRCWRWRTFQAVWASPPPSSKTRLRLPALASPSIPNCALRTKSLRGRNYRKQGQISSIFQIAYFGWECRSSILGRSASHSCFERISFLDEKGPPNAGFSYRGKSLETGVRTFSAKNSRKSPAESRKTPVFWRLGLETEE